MSADSFTRTVSAALAVLRSGAASAPTSAHPYSERRIADAASPVAHTAPGHARETGEIDNGQS